MKERDGFIGLHDFPGELIRLFEQAGFIYHSRVMIWKDPLTEATRTKALGLMHKQIMKDSSMCRQGLKRIYQDESGKWWGFGDVMDYIGIGWKDDPHGNLNGQIGFFEEVNTD